MSVVQNYHAKFIIQRVLEKKLPSCSFALLRQKNQDHLLTLSGSIFGQLQKKFNIYTLRDDCTTPRLYSMIEHIVCPLDALSTKKASEFFFLKKVSRFSKKEVLKGKKSWLVTTHSNGNNRGMSYAQKVFERVFKVYFGYVCFIQQDASCFNLRNSQSDNLVPWCGFYDPWIIRTIFPSTFSAFLTDNKFPLNFFPLKSQLSNLPAHDFETL